MLIQLFLEIITKTIIHQSIDYYCKKKVCKPQLPLFLAITIIKTNVKFLIFVVIFHSLISQKTPN